MKVSSSKDVTIEDALSIVMEYMNKEEKNTWIATKEVGDSK